jgi:hypothetical protein
MEWHEFDIEDAEKALANAAHRVALAGGARPHFRAQIAELETVIDWFHRFNDLELDLLV